MMSKNMLSMGIDIGTSACKITILDINGNISATVSADYPTYYPFPGWAEQNPKDWKDAITSAIAKIRKEIKSKINCTRSITLTSAAHIAVLLDDRNEPIRNAILWNDQRSFKEVEELIELNGEKIFARTGNFPSTTWTLPHLIWVRKHEPENWEKLNRVCLSKDYIIYWLTGNWITDPGTAVSSLLCDIDQKKWSDRFCSLAGLNINQLPSINEAKETAGPLLKKRVEEFSFGKECTVINGSLDSAMEIYGAGIDESNETLIRIGTAGGIYSLGKRRIIRKGLVTYPFIKNDIWYSQAGTNAAGSIIKRMVELIYCDENKNPFQKLIKIAESAPPASDGLIFLPFLLGERAPYWNPSLRGSFTGISFRHGPEHFIRSAIEGVAFSLADAFYSLYNNDNMPDAIKVIGGGASDMFLLQILSNIIKIPIIPLEKIGSAYGAALFGIFVSDCAYSIKKVAIDHKIVKPKKEELSIYEQAFSDYKKICRFMQNMYNELKR